MAALNILWYACAPMSDHASNVAMFSLCSGMLWTRKGFGMSENKNESKSEKVTTLIAKPENGLCVSINSQQPMASAPSAPPPPKPKR